MYCYLKGCLEGQALELVTEVHERNKRRKRYHAAWKSLEERYADPYVLANALLRKVTDWKDIHIEDGDDLNNFATLLERCLVEKRCAHMDVLDAHVYVSSIRNKLPDKFKEKWAEKVVAMKKRGKGHPLFKDIVRFIKHESEVVNEPFFGRKTFKSAIEVPQEESHSGMSCWPKSVNNCIAGGIQARPGAWRGAVGPEQCAFCDAAHLIDVCNDFLTRPFAERKSFLIMHKLCFACLRPGHLASQCNNRLTCRMCFKKHATALHYSASYTHKVPMQTAIQPGSIAESVSMVRTGKREEEARIDSKPLKVQGPTQPDHGYYCVDPQRELAKMSLATKHSHQNGSGHQ